MYWFLSYGLERPSSHRFPSPSPEDVDSFECLSSRAHFCRFVSNVSARVLISDADADSFECLSSRGRFCRFVWNVLARVLISDADANSFE